MAKMISSPVRVTIDSVEGKYGYTADSAGICDDGTKVTAINLYHNENAPAGRFEVPFLHEPAVKAEPTEEEKHKPHLARVLRALQDAELALLDEAQQRAAFEEEAAKVRRKNKFAIQRAILVARQAGLPFESVIKLDGSGYDELLESVQSLMCVNTDLDTILDV